VAQSAISHHLASLEAELDRQLVTRGPKGIALTEAGAVLYRHAEAILRHVESARQEVSSRPNVPSGHVSIGLPPALAAVLGFELFVRMRNAYPQILLQLSNAKSSLLRERLDNGRLDIALLFVGQAERGLTVEPLLIEELFYVTAGPDSSPIGIADAAQRPLLMCGPASGIQCTVQDVFRKHGLTVTPIGEFDALFMLRRAIASGIGDSILPWSALHDGHQTIALNCRRFADATLARPVALCFSDVGQRSPAIEAVALTLKSLVRELVENGTWQGVSMIAPPAEPSCSAAPPV
jgi:DNA-binding transcriptional LysR family regulator